MTPRSLRAGLTRAALITTLSALVVSAAAIAGVEFFRYREQRGVDLRSRADVLAHAIAPALVFGDRATAGRQLAALQNAPELLSAVVLGREGEEFASFHARGGRAAVIVPSEAPRVTFGMSTVTLLRPVSHDDEVVGHIYLAARHDLWSRIVGYAGLQAIVLAATLFGGTWLFRRLQAAAIQPLSDVAAVAEQLIHRNDWSLRAPPSRYVELTPLVTAFNRMLDEVALRTAVLEAETRERLRAEVELRSADEQKDVFLATLAHELRNPLAPMTVAVSLLKKPGQAEPVRQKCIGILDRQLAHTIRLIDDLLDVSRIRVGKLTLRTEAVDLLAILRSALELIEPMVASKEQQLHADLRCRDLLVIGDPTRLLQVFSNLLTNASRYTPDGGKIEVLAQSQEPHACVSVKDTGMGVDPAMQQRIFEMFQQADQSLERGSAGLGIGLTLASQLAKLHGGDISLASEGLGKGACFTLRLPLAPAGTRLPVEPQPSAGHAAGGLRILIADDNVDAAVGLKDAFEAEGHAVEVQHDGLAAVEAIQTGRFDAAVLDIGMPGLNGYDVARRVRAAGDFGTVLVALTGWGQPSDRQRAFASGFDHHVVKPASPDQLLASIERGRPRAAPSRTSEDKKP